MHGHRHLLWQREALEGAEERERIHPPAGNPIREIEYRGEISKETSWECRMNWIQLRASHNFVVCEKDLTQVARKRRDGLGSRQEKKHRENERDLF